MNMGKWKLVAAGVFFSAVGVFALFDSAGKSTWPRASAEVTSLVVECDMKATEHKVVYKEVSEATIPCESVEYFKALHSDKSWSVTERFEGTLLVASADGSAVQAVLNLKRLEGRAPEVGDRIEVLQDPANPAKIARTDTTGTGIMIGLVCGLIGAGALWFAFGFKGFGGGKAASKPSAMAGLLGSVLPGGKKPGAKRLSLAQDEEADAKASADRADAMIAAALARNGAAPRVAATMTPRATTQVKAPVTVGVKTGVKTGVTAAAKTAATVRTPMVQPGTRTGFGLKR